MVGANGAKFYYSDPVKSGIHVMSSIPILRILYRELACSILIMFFVNINVFHACVTKEFMLFWKQNIRSIFVFVYASINVVLYDGN